MTKTKSPPPKKHKAADSGAHHKNHHSINMDKVKIKRVKRNKKKITTAEKIMAGVGVGSSLLGGASMIKPKANDREITRPAPADSKVGGKSVKQTLKDVFNLTLGAPKAEAANLAVDPNSGQMLDSSGGLEYDSQGNPIFASQGNSSTSADVSVGGGAAVSGTYAGSTYTTTVNGVKTNVQGLAVDASGNVITNSQYPGGFYPGALTAQQVTDILNPSTATAVAPVSLTKDSGTLPTRTEALGASDITKSLSAGVLSSGFTNADFQSFFNSPFLQDANGNYVVTDSSGQQHTLSATDVGQLSSYAQSNQGALPGQLTGGSLLAYMTGSGLGVTSDQATSLGYDSSGKLGGGAVTPGFTGQPYTAPTGGGAVTPLGGLHDGQSTGGGVVTGAPVSGFDVYGYQNGVRMIGVGLSDGTGGSIYYANGQYLLIDSSGNTTNVSNDPAWADARGALANNTVVNAGSLVGNDSLPSSVQSALFTARSGGGTTGTGGVTGDRGTSVTTTGGPTTTVDIDNTPYDVWKVTNPVNPGQNALASWVGSDTDGNALNQVVYIVPTIDASGNPGYRAVDASGNTVLVSQATIGAIIAKDKAYLDSLPLPTPPAHGITPPVTPPTTPPSVTPTTYDTQVVGGATQIYMNGQWVDAATAFKNSAGNLPYDLFTKLSSSEQQTLTTYFSTINASSANGNPLTDATQILPGSLTAYMLGLGNTPNNSSATALGLTWQQLKDSKGNLLTNSDGTPLMGYVRIPNMATGAGIGSVKLLDATSQEITDLGNFYKNNPSQIPTSVDPDSVAAYVLGLGNGENSDGSRYTTKTVNGQTFNLVNGAWTLQASGGGGTTSTLPTIPTGVNPEGIIGWGTTDGQPPKADGSNVIPKSQLASYVAAAYIAMGYPQYTDYVGSKPLVQLTDSSGKNVTINSVQDFINYWNAKYGDGTTKPTDADWQAYLGFFGTQGMTLGSLKASNTVPTIGPFAYTQGSAMIPGAGLPPYLTIDLQTGKAWAPAPANLPLTGAWASGWANFQVPHVNPDGSLDFTGMSAQAKYDYLYFSDPNRPFDWDIDMWGGDPYQVNMVLRPAAGMSAPTAPTYKTNADGSVTVTPGNIAVNNFVVWTDAQGNLQITPTSANVTDAGPNTVKGSLVNTYNGAVIQPGDPNWKNGTPAMQLSDGRVIPVSQFDISGTGMTPELFNAAAMSYLGLGPNPDSALNKGLPYVPVFLGPNANGNPALDTVLSYIAAHPIGHDNTLAAIQASGGIAQLDTFSRNSPQQILAGGNPAATSTNTLGGGGGASSGSTATIIQPITNVGLSSSSGKAGDSITVTGNNFSSVAGKNVVQFYSANTFGSLGTLAGTATVTSNASGQIKFTVPNLATGQYALRFSNDPSQTVFAYSQFTIVTDNSGGGGTGTGSGSVVTTPTALAGATVGTAYSQSLTWASHPSAVWSLATANNLPPGLALSGAGVISGTPTTAGSYTFTINATDGTNTASQTFSITVSPASTTSGAVALATATVGVSYSQGLPTTTSSGQTIGSWRLDDGSALPPGLSLGSSTGIISGTPTAAGNYTFTVLAHINGVTGNVITIYSIAVSPASATTGGTLTIGQSLGTNTSTQTVLITYASSFDASGNNTNGVFAPGYTIQIGGTGLSAYSSFTLIIGGQQVPVTQSVITDNKITLSFPTGMPSGLANGSVIQVKLTSIQPGVSSGILSQTFLLQNAATGGGGGSGSGGGGGGSTGGGLTADQQTILALQNQIANLQAQLAAMAAANASAGSASNSAAYNNLVYQIQQLQQQLSNANRGGSVVIQTSDLSGGLKMPPGYPASGGTLDYNPPPGYYVGTPPSGLQMPSNSSQVAGAQQSATYTVKKGDTLWAIAKKYYGDGNKWRKILSANPNCLSIPGNTKTLKIGAVLTIPNL